MNEVSGRGLYVGPHQGHRCVNYEAVKEALRAPKVHRMIHGHTHRPAIHTMDSEGTIAERVVLGDWYEQTSMLSIEFEIMKLSNLERTTTHV